VLYVVYFIHIITSIFLILVVLLQQGKGADLSVFGGGSTQAAFGARGAATLLHKLTVGFFVLFMVTTLSIGILQRSGRKGSSVMVEVETPATTELTEEAADVELLEGEGVAVEEALAEEAAEATEVMIEEAPEAP
jgi:preprotein translocase subunit SecG